MSEVVQVVRTRLPDGRQILILSYEEAQWAWGHLHIKPLPPPRRRVAHAEELLNQLVWLAVETKDERFRAAADALLEQRLIVVEGEAEREGAPFLRASWVARRDEAAELAEDLLIDAVKAAGPLIQKGVTPRLALAAMIAVFRVPGHSFDALNKRATKLRKSLET